MRTKRHEHEAKDQEAVRAEERRRRLASFAPAPEVVFFNTHHDELSAIAERDSAKFAEWEATAGEERGEKMEEMARARRARQESSIRVNLRSVESSARPKGMIAAMQMMNSKQ